MILDKRDNMGFQIAPSLIIFLVILGAGGMVVCGFAVFLYGGDIEDESSWSARSPEQDAYMREIRERNWDELARIGMQSMHGPSDGDHAHAPMSPRSEIRPAVKSEVLGLTPAVVTATPRTDEGADAKASKDKGADPKASTDEGADAKASTDEGAAAKPSGN